MAKPVSSAMLAMLEQPNATKPVVILGISWGLTVDFYSTRPVEGCNSNIMSIGDIRDEVRSDNTSNAGATSVTFSDSDGAMKSILDVRNPEKAPATVFLAYEGIGQGDWMELMKGNVVGPVRWSEGERTVSFDIEFHIDDNEIGYSATEEDFSDINPEAQGVPWPMIFGTCCHVPTLHIRKRTVGYLQVPCRFYRSPSYTEGGGAFFLIANPDVLSFLNDSPVANVLYVEGGDKFPQGHIIKIIINDVVFDGTFNGSEFTVAHCNLAKYTNIGFAARGGDADNQNYRVAWLNQDISLVNHYCYIVKGGGREICNLCVKQIDRKCWFRTEFTDPTTHLLSLPDATWSVSEAYGISKNGMVVDLAGTIDHMKDKLGYRFAQPSQSALGKIKKAIDGLEGSANAWWQASADEEVRLWDTADPDIYLCSLVQLSEIKAVYGKRKIQTPDGKTKEIFAQIPDAYFTRQLASDYTILGQTASALIFDAPLTAYAGQDWTEDVYVSATSTVGPNPADIIKWAILNWTDLGVNTPSFDAVSSYLNDGTTNANFTLFDKRNTIKFCQEIAFQSRCALLLDSPIIKIVYLAKQPNQSWNFEEQSTEFKSFELGFTPVSEINTKLLATYSEDYREKRALSEVRELSRREFENILQALVPSNRRAKSETICLIYKNNINRYGLHVRQEACYIFCRPEPVQLFLDFWGNRFSKSWRTVTMKVPMIGTMLQPFDGIVLDYADLGILNIEIIKGVCMSKSFSFSDMSVTLEIELPIASGEIHVDPNYWPG